jgi:hypothetical protein
MIFRGHMADVTYWGLALGNLNLITLWFYPGGWLPGITWWRRSFPCTD